MVPVVIFIKQSLLESREKSVITELSSSIEVRGSAECSNELIFPITQSTGHEGYKVNSSYTTAKNLYFFLFLIHKQLILIKCVFPFR